VQPGGAIRSCVVRAARAGEEEHESFLGFLAYGVPYLGEKQPFCIKTAPPCHASIESSTVACRLPAYGKSLCPRSGERISTRFTFVEHRIRAAKTVRPCQGFPLGNHIALPEPQGAWPHLGYSLLMSPR